MKNILRSVLIVTGILFVLVLVTASLDNSSTNSAVTLTDLAGKINAGEVQSIIVRQDTLQITYTDDTRASVKKESSDSAFQTLTDYGAKPEQLAKIKIEVRDPGLVSSIVSSLIPIVLPFLLLGGLFWYMFRQAQRGQTQAFTFGKSKARLAGLNESQRKITFKDVAGLTEAKEEVSEVVEFLRDHKKFEALGARIPRGILLVGGPGTGKTLLAKAVANEANVPFYFVSGSDFVEMFVGVGATRVRDTFELAKKTSPAIVFIDEIDAVGRHRGAGMGGGHDEREQTLNQILVEMDGFESNEAVIVLAATNRPDILDPALLRPGRFDRRVILVEPDLNDREAVLRLHTTDKPLAPDVDLRVVAERTAGLSGADLANLVNEAALLAARKDQKELAQHDLLQAIEKVILGPERRSHVLSTREKEITAYHEAGHAIVAASLPHTDPVHKVSIVSRGRAGGYTLKLPSQDRHMRTKAEFESELAVLMGGYSSERLIFEDFTTGASNDLQVASDLARRMVTQYGMSDKLGPVSFGEREEMVFLGKEFSGAKNYSETIAYEIDKEVERIIADAFARAQTVLKERMDTLHLVAKTLIQKETLEQKEFYELVGTRA